MHEIDADTVETCHRSCANKTALLFRSQILSSWIYDFTTFQEDLNAPFNLLHFTDNYNKAFVRRELVRTDAIFIFILIKKRLWGIHLQSVKWVVLLLVNEIWLFKNSSVQKKKPPKLLCYGLVCENFISLKTVQPIKQTALLALTALVLFTSNLPWCLPWLKSICKVCLFDEVLPFLEITKCSFHKPNMNNIHKYL